MLMVIFVAANISSLELSRTDGFFDRQWYDDLEIGRNVRLVQLPSGQYHWRKMRALVNFIGHIDYEIDGAGYGFDVREGEMNYAGDFYIGRQPGAGMVMRQINRTSRALDWLDESHPELLRAYPLRFAGGVEDPFPEYWNRLQQSDEQP